VLVFYRFKRILNYTEFKRKFNLYSLYITTDEKDIRSVKIAKYLLHSQVELQNCICLCVQRTQVYRARGGEDPLIINSGIRGGKCQLDTHSYVIKIGLFQIN
jgi:hypothetical protein